MDEKYKYSATLTRVIDGDTVVLQLHRTVDVDFGFRFKTTMFMSFEASFRIAGINCAELHSHNAKEKLAGQAAKDKLVQLLALGPITVFSQKPEGPLESDKYGRWICVIKVLSPSGEIDIAATLLSLGLAVEYDGKTARAPWVDSDEVAKP
jgi:endonuclease YncB( thermonuclease family)